MLLGLMLSSSRRQVPNVPTAPTTKRMSDTTAAFLLRQPRVDGGGCELFLDGIVPLQLEREDVAGATIAIVKEGNFFCKRLWYAT